MNSINYNPLQATIKWDEIEINVTYYPRNLIMRVNEVKISGIQLFLKGHAVI